MVNKMTPKRIYPTIIIVFLQFSLCFAVSQEASYHILEDMHTFSTNYPRIENSEGERKSLQFITESLRELGVDHEVRYLDSFEDFHSFSATVEAFFPGTGDSELFLLFPHN